MKLNIFPPKLQLAQERFCSDSRLLALICSMLLFLLFCVPLNALSGYVYSAYLEDCLVSSRSIFVCSDNSVVVLGNLDYNYGPWTQYLSITKLDPAGNLLWREMMGGTTIYLAITGIDIDENDTVTFITTALQYDGVINLWSIDSNGNFTLLSEEYSIPNPRGSHFNKALRTPNNEIVAIGKTCSFQHELSACFYRFSASGDTLATAFWQSDGNSPYYGPEAYDLAIKDDGNILITCQLNSGVATILEIDPMGNIVNRIDVPEPFIKVQSSLALAKSPHSSEYLIVGPFEEYPDTAISAYLLNDNELTYAFSVDPNIVNWSHSAMAHGDGIFICGIDGVSNGMLVSLSDSGELNWTWQEGGANVSNYHVEGIGMASTALLAMDSDGCVYWAWGGGATQRITKLLPNGQVPVEDDVQSPPATMISAYPNPMKEEIRIKIKQGTQGAFQGNDIEVFNIKGQLIRSLELTKNETVWDGRDSRGKFSPNGVYFLRCKASPGQIRKIIKIN